MTKIEKHEAAIRKRSREVKKLMRDHQKRSNKEKSWRSR